MPNKRFCSWQLCQKLKGGAEINISRTCRQFRVLKTQALADIGRASMLSASVKPLYAWLKLPARC